VKPFSIVCTTCQARLSVRSAAAIGQILACPKCASMVLIQYPEGAAAQSESQTASDRTPPPTPAGEPRSRMPAEPVPESVAGPPPPIPAPPGTPPDAAPAKPPRKQRFREDFSVDPDDAAAQPGGDRESAETPPVPAADGGSLAGETTDLLAPALSRFWQWLLLGGAAVLGIVLAFFLVAFLASRRPVSVVHDGPPSPSRDPSRAQQATAPAAKSKVDSSDGAAVPVPGSVQNADSDHAAPKSTDASAAEKSGTAPAQEQPPADPDEPGKSPADAAPPAMEDAPPDVVPPVEKPEQPAAATGNGTEDSATTVPTPSVDGTESTGTAGGVAAPGRDIPTQLAVVVPGIEFERVTVANFADFIAAFVDVPVTLDLDAMLARGVSANTELAFQFRGVTVQQLLDVSLERVGLVVVAGTHGLLITTSAALNRDMRTESYDVFDLADDESKADVLGRQVASLIAPSSWRETEGQGTWSVSDHSLEVYQTDAGHFQVVRFLDRLRLARGLLPRGELAYDLVDLVPAFEKAEAELNRPITMSFPEPTTVAAILDFLQTETDLRLLTHWQETAQVGWLPTTKTTAAGTAQPLGTQLDNWLEPHGLGYRLPDAKTLQITSKTSLAATRELEIYPLTGVAESDAAALIEQLKREVGEEPMQAATSTDAIVFDPPSRSLLVSRPQPDQRKIARWLLANGKRAAAGPQEK